MPKSRRPSKAQRAAILPCSPRSPPGLSQTGSTISPGQESQQQGGMAAWNDLSFEICSGFRPGSGRGEVQGARGSLRYAQPCREAAALRPRRGRGAFPSKSQLFSRQGKACVGRRSQRPCSIAATTRRGRTPPSTGALARFRLLRGACCGTLFGQVGQEARRGSR